MTIHNRFNVMNNSQYPYYGGPSFRENYQGTQIITKPIEKVEYTVEVIDEPVVEFEKLKER